MFSVRNLQLGRGITTSTAQGSGTSVIHSYIDDQTTVANIKLAFPPFLDQGEGQDFILLTDYMFITGSDTAILARITSLDPFTVDVDLFSGAAGLSVAAPIPPVDSNGAKITAGVLQLEFADQTHPGIMSAAPQDFGGEKTFHADVNIVEPVDGLFIEKTMGNFGVTLQTNDPTAQPGIGFVDQALPGQFFGTIYSRNGFILSNPELYLVGGNNAGIVLNDTVGTVTIGNNTITNVLDSAVGQSLSIGATNALSVDIGTTLTVDATKELLVNTIDTLSAVPLEIGGTNASVISLLENTAIPAGKQLLVNTIDTITAAPLEIGATTATFIDLQKDVRINSANQLLTNTIDSRTATTLVLGSTNTTVAVMNKGVQFLTSGGTPATLNDYEEYTHNTTFTLNTLTTANIPIVFTKVGKAITARITIAGSVLGQAAPGTSFSADTVLPARFRPADDCSSLVRITNNNVASVGTILIGSAGTISIFASADTTQNFTALVSNGFSRSNFAYSL
jgi:hypothetical protein